jgi:cell fate regulator YaaT (PSP1 superfamily)
MEGILVVRFRKTGKLVYMNPLKFGFRVGDCVIAETEKGQEIGRIVKIVAETELPQGTEVKNIIRPSTKYDLITQRDNELEAEKVLEF